MINSRLHLSHFSAEEKILWMTGTHGSEDGRSALTDIDLTDHGFYLEDCWKFGIKSGPRRTTNRPPLSFQQPFSDADWQRLPDITKPAEVVESPPPGSFYADEELKKMDIRLANMSYYFGHAQKFLDDIAEVQH